MNKQSLITIVALTAAVSLSIFIGWRELKKLTSRINDMETYINSHSKY